MDSNRLKSQSCDLKKQSALPVSPKKYSILYFLFNCLFARLEGINLWTEQKVREFFQRTNIGQSVQYNDAILNQSE